MNERIESIAVETLSFLRHNVLSRSDMEDISIPDVFMEKFAELIVRECIGVIGEENYTMLTGKAYCTELKRHFGVK